MEGEDLFIMQERPSPEMQNLAIMKEEVLLRPAPEMQNLAIMKDELFGESLEAFASLQGQAVQSMAEVTVEDVELGLRRLELELHARGVDLNEEEGPGGEGLAAIPELALPVRSASLPDIFRRETSLTDELEPVADDIVLEPAQLPLADQLDDLPAAAMGSLVAAAGDVRQNNNNKNKNQNNINNSCLGTDRSPGPRVDKVPSTAALGDVPPEELSDDFDHVFVEGLDVDPLVDTTALHEDTAAEEALAAFRGRSDNSIGFGDAMRSLDSYAKGSKSREHEQLVFVLHLQTAVRVACWSLILALPIIIWPVAIKMKSMGRSESEYLSFWGSMLLQFLFCIGPTLGASVQYTVEGLFGTTLATANMYFLNYVMGFWLRGGAFANRLEIFNPVSNTTLIRSRWLPLCSNSNDLSFDNCILNIDIARVEGAELAKALFVLADLLLVVFAVLSIGFNINTRVFCISTHIYFVMSFLDPNTGSFNTAPTLATHYFVIVFAASFAVILCFLIPFPITSYAKAHKLAEEVGLAVAMVLESLPLTSIELCREKVQSAIEEADIIFADLDYHLRVMWFEDFGFGMRAVRRRWLHAYVEALKESKRHAGAVLHAAAAVPRSETERFQAALPSLRRLLSLVGSSLRTSHFTKTPADLKELCRSLEEKQAVLLADLAVEFRGAQVPGAEGLTPPSLVFALALCGIVKDTSHAVRCLELWERKSQEDEEVPGFGRGGSSRCLRKVWRHYNSMLHHFDFKMRVIVVTHPRFVLRNTFTIFIAFLLGWIGVSNTLASYSSGPAGTASVIMYTFTGTSIPITLKRLNGVVLGAVIGSVAQRLFAIQTIWHAICYSVFLLAFVSFFMFHALHSKQNANVACLTAGYGISAMMPPGGIFRELAVKVNSSSNSFLFANVVGTVLGVVVLMFVDTLLASSARHQARQRLVRSLNLTSKLVSKVLSPGGVGEEKEVSGPLGPGCGKSEWSDEKSEKTVDDQRWGVCCLFCRTRRKSQEDSKSENENDEDTSGADLSHALKEDLNELVGLLPHAAMEPGRGVDMFRSDLYAEMEKGLRTLAEHFGTLGWAIQLLETPQRRRSLRAGTFVFSEKKTDKAGGRSTSPSATPLMRTDLFKPILATLGSELQLMLSNIGILAEDLTKERHLAQTLRPKTEEEQERDAEAEKVREVLQAKLYTRAVGTAFCRVAVSPWRSAWNTAKGSAAARTARSAYQRAQVAKKRNELVSNERKKLLAPAAVSQRAPLQRSASDPLLGGGEAAKEAGLEPATDNNNNNLNAVGLGPALAPQAQSGTASSSGSKDSKGISSNNSSGSNLKLSGRLKGMGIQELRKRKKDLERLARQLREENLEDGLQLVVSKAPHRAAVPEEGAGAADNSSLRLLLLFENLRKTAETRRGDLPQTDALSMVELLIFLLGSVQTQIQHMQLSLLGYG